VERAWTWLSAAETTMPLVFKNMAGASDEMILNEALFEMRQRYNKTGFPLDPRELLTYLSGRAKAHLVLHLYRVALQRGDYAVQNGLLIPN
jgi:hypothetical protein